jgi:hypothetical protein
MPIWKFVVNPFCKETLKGDDDGIEEGMEERNGGDFQRRFSFRFTYSRDLFVSNVLDLFKVKN